MCDAATMPAPSRAPPAPATIAAAAGSIDAPFAPSMVGNAAGGVKVFTVASEWIGLVKPVPFSVQPKQGWPVPTGQEAKPTSPKPTAGQLALVKPLSRPSYILAKVAVLTGFLAVLTLAATVVCGLVTFGLFGDVPIHKLLILTACWLVLAIFFIGVMTLLSTAVRSQAAAAGVGIGIYFGASIVALWAPAKRYTPVGLMGAYNAIAAGRPVSLLWPIVSSLALATLAVLLAIAHFQRQSIR